MAISDKAGGLFFLDSGAHSLYTKYVIAKQYRDGYSLYKTPEFWQYVDAYATFVKENKDCIDYYANVDVIFNPEMSWEVLKYLEDKHGLRPVPVVHYGTDLKWIGKHLGAGYEYLGLGGLGQEVTAVAYRKWADRVFEMICPLPDRLPVVRTHGFAMTSYDLLIRYPWWSVDSSTWTKVGAFGSVLIPHYRRGKFTFDEQPWQITTSEESPDAKEAGRHYRTLSPQERLIVDRWLEEIDIPLGRTAPDGEIIEYGVTNRHSERKIANLLFFERLRSWLPEYPWPFKPPAGKKTTAGGGLFG